MLEGFRKVQCKSTMTLIDVKLEKLECVRKDVMNLYPYQSLIGALMYLAVTARPDIAYAVNCFSQFNTNYDV